MAKTPFTPYQRRLFVFLSVATFFEGYDFQVFSRILPHLRDYWRLDEGDVGLMSTIINVGTVLAYPLVRLADRVGRRTILTITIIGYMLFTFATGFAPDPVSFTIAQLLARVFLIGEWAISMIYAAEEFPAERRGTVLGVIGGFSSLGAIVCAGIVPFLVATPWGWRTSYLVAVIPLVIIAFARRGLRETARFETLKAAGAVARRGLFAIWRTPHRRRVLQLSLIWGTSYIASVIGVLYWSDYATNEAHLTDKQVSAALATASLVSMPLVFGTAKLIDVLGRRPTAALVFSVSAVGTFLSYTLRDQWPLTFALMLGIYGVAAYLPILNAYTSELFPTELRSDAFAWSNNLLGRLTYVAAPWVVGTIAKGSGWGSTVRVLAVFPLITIVLIYALLPETRNRELEDTSALA